jgi:Fe-S cluster assembly protein SufD
MSQVLDNRKSTTHSNYSRLQREILQPSPAQPWLDKLRKNAIARFDLVGFPNSKVEYWRHTNFQPIARTNFDLAGPATLDDVSPLVEQYTFGNEASVELVFVNGHFNGALSRVPRLPRGVKIMSLPQALAGSESTLIEKHLAQHASIEKNPFVALNTGFIREGAFIHLPSGTVFDGSIHLLFLSMGGDTPQVSHPRVLVVAEDRVTATIVETYAGEHEQQGGRNYFTNAVTEIVTGNDCNIDHCRLQQESIGAFHVSTMQVLLGAATNFVSHAATTGGRLTRNDLNCIMSGERAYATLNGLVLLNGEQHCDNHTLLHHEKAHCPSHELYKHVLDGRSTAVFKGQIFVQKDAQKTDSKQTSKTLLLSDDAYMNSQPALEIYADDVKCTHGSTIGPVDQDMLFYLRTRGVSMEAARHLLTYAFAADVTRRIKVDPVRRRIENYMAAQHGLPQDLSITDVTTHDEAAL